VDGGNHAVRAIDLVSGTIDTVAGGARCAVPEDADHPSSYCPDGVAAAAMGLNTPQGIAFDPYVNLYIADTHNHRIVRVQH
jgi:hypothetical protein